MRSKAERTWIAIVFFLFGCALGVALGALDRPECRGTAVPRHCVD